MITIRLMKFTAPGKAWVEALPKGAQWSVIFSSGHDRAAEVKVEVYCEPYQMEAVRDALARFSIELSDTYIPSSLADCDLVPQPVRLDNQ